MNNCFLCENGHIWMMPAPSRPRQCPVCSSSRWQLVADASTAEQPVVLAAPVEQLDPVGKSPTQTLPAIPLRRVPAVSPSPAPVEQVADSRRQADQEQTLLPQDHSAAVRIEETLLRGDSVVRLLSGDEETAERCSSVPTGEALPQVPGYEILGELGRGGMGVVYKARQLSLQRIVALKMILAGSHADAETRARFRREAEAVAALQHPCIVQIYEIGEAGGHPYLALEYVDGGNLASYLEHGPWPPHLAAELTLLLTQAVHYAHQHGIIHRDLKPANVLLRRIAPAADKGEGTERAPAGPPALAAPRDLQPKITDFGLAKRLEESHSAGTRSGAVMGTPSYIAPEQAAGRSRDIGPAVDIYSLGAILYELLTGRPPFVGESPLDTILQVLQDEPVPPRHLVPSVPPDLETICLKCLEKQPQRRYPSAAALARDLRRFLDGEPIEARPLSGRERLSRWVRRHPVWTVLIVAALTTLLALVGVLSVAYLQVRDAVRQREAEADAARQARLDEARARRQAEELAQENERRRREAEQSNERLQQEIEERRRSNYALQLMQIATVAESDPSRAMALLDDRQRCPPDLRDFTWAYLHRLCQRQAMVYLPSRAQPHPPAIRAVAWSARGSFAACGDDSGQVRIWDPRTGQTWLASQAHAGRIAALAFTPDESALVTAGEQDGAVRLWELPLELLQNARRSLDLLPPLRPLVRPLRLQQPAAEVIQTADAPTAAPTALAVSSDGRVLVTGAADGTLRWWDLAAVHAPPIEAPLRQQPSSWAALLGCPLPAELAARPRGRLRLLTDVPVRAHEPSSPNGDARQAFRGVTVVSFAALNRVLLSAGADGYVRLWAGDGSRLLWGSPQFAPPIRAAALSPDGQYVAVADSRPTPLIHLIQPNRPTSVRRLSGHTAVVYALAFSPDGEWLASGSFDRSVRLWDLRGQERAILHGHTQTVTTLAFSPDRRLLLSGSTDGSARLWWSQPQRCDTEELPLNDTAVAASASADGRLILFAPERGDIVAGLWPFPRPDRFRLVATTFTKLPRSVQLRLLSAAPNGQSVLASVESPQGAALLLWQRAPQLKPPGRDKSSFPDQPVSLPWPQPIHAVAWDSTSRTVALLDAAGLWLWDLRAKPHCLYGTPAPNRLVREVVFDPADRLLAVATADQQLLILDRQGRLLARQEVPGEVSALAWGGPRSEWLASAHRDGTIQIWRWDGAQPEQQRLVRQANVAGHAGPVYALAFSPNGRTLASGGHDRVVLLSDPQTGQERARLAGHSERIIRLQFLAYGTALLSFTRDGAVSYWPAGGRPAQVQRF